MALLKAPSKKPKTTTLPGSDGGSRQTETGELR